MHCKAPRTVNDMDAEYSDTVKSHSVQWALKMLACEHAHRFVRTGLKIESRRSGNCSVCNGEWDLFPPLLCYTSSTRFRALRSAIFFVRFSLPGDLVPGL